MKDNCTHLKLLAVAKHHFNTYKGVDRSYLFHYTSAKVLPLILQLNHYSFKMTCSSDFEDKDEGVLIESIYPKVLEQMLNEGTIDRELFDSLSDLKPIDKMRGYVWPRFLSELMSFVLCFANQNNSDYMWKNHCKPIDSGVNIVVGTHLFHSHFFTVENYPPSNHKPFFDFQVLKVIYDRKEQYSIVLKRIKELINAYKPDSHHDKEDIMILRFYIADCLKQLRLSFKKNSFNNESEVRIVFNISLNDANYYNCVNTDKDNRKFVYLNISNLNNSFLIHKSPYFNVDKYSTPNCILIKPDNDDYNY